MSDTVSTLLLRTSTKSSERSDPVRPRAAFDEIDRIAGVIKATHRLPISAALGPLSPERFHHRADSKIAAFYLFWIRCDDLNATSKACQKGAWNGVKLLLRDVSPLTRWAP
jgi:hypothetical protein